MCRVQCIVRSAGIPDTVIIQQGALYLNANFVSECVKRDMGGDKYQHEDKKFFKMRFRNPLQ